MVTTAAGSIKHSLYSNYKSVLEHYVSFYAFVVGTLYCVRILRDSRNEKSQCITCLFVRFVSSFECLVVVVLRMAQELQFWANMCACVDIWLFSRFNRPQLESSLKTITAESE